MRNSVVLIIPLVVLSAAGQVLRLPSSYENGVKWEFDSNVFDGNVLARSKVGQVPAAPAVHKKQLAVPVVPVVRKEPVVTTVYKKVPVPDVYEKSVIPTTFGKEPVVQNVRKQWPVMMPAVVKAQSVASNVYKSEPVSIVRNVHKQQAVPSFVQKTHPVVSNVCSYHRYKSQPIRPYVHHRDQSLQQFVVPKVIPVESQQKVEPGYQYNPQHFVRGNVQAVPHN